MVNNRLRVAVEDRFIIFNLREDSTMLPEGNLLDDFVSILRAFTGTYKVLCDWSKLRGVTYDVADFVSNLSVSTGATILARSSDVHVIRQALGNDAPILEVGSRRLPVQFRPIEIEMFDSRLSSWDLDKIDVELQDPDYAEEEDWKSLKASADLSYISDHPDDKVRWRYLRHAIQGLGRNSLLTEFTMQMCSNEVALPHIMLTHRTLWKPNTISS
jgi:hypothetical protein